MKSDDVTITCIFNGPLRISGAFSITLPNGEIKRMEQAAICRCGLSDNMPFCDGNHKNVIPRHDEK